MQGLRKDDRGTVSARQFDSRVENVEVRARTTESPRDNDGRHQMGHNSIHHLLNSSIHLTILFFFRKT